VGKAVADDCGPGAGAPPAWQRTRAEERIRVLCCLRFLSTEDPRSKQCLWNATHLEVGINGHAFGGQRNQRSVAQPDKSRAGCADEARKCCVRNFDWLRLEPTPSGRSFDPVLIVREQLRWRLRCLPIRRHESVCPAERFDRR
jgi:hypothetical protein